jgi:TRAP-type C4-dicarboxylate transport system permease small subunit
MIRQNTNPQSRIARILETFARVLNGISAVWLASIALLILYDVVGREIFLTPFHGTNEIVSNSVLSILFLQLPLSILTRASLRTTIIYGLASPRGKAWIDATSYFLAGALFLVISVGSWPNMIEAWDILEQEGSGVVNIPVYPIRTLVVFVSIVGVAICALMVYEALSGSGAGAHPGKSGEAGDAPSPDGA